MILLPPEVEGEDAHPHHWGTSGGQGRSEHPHIHGVDEDIVKDNVKQAPRQHRGHGQARLKIIADKIKHHIVEHKGHGKGEDDPDILHHIGQGRGGGSQQQGNFPGKAESHQGDGGADGHGHRQGLGKNTVKAGGVPPAIGDGKQGTAAHADEHPQAADQAEKGDGDVERYQAGASHPVGHKEGIRQNVEG